MVYANNPITEDVETAGALGIPGYPPKAELAKIQLRERPCLNKRDEGR